jgi:hypothetical protein
MSLVPDEKAVKVWKSSNRIFYGKSKKKNLQFQSSIVDNGRDYVLYYVGISDMHIF